MHSTDGPVTQGAGRQILARATALLRQDPRIADIVQPQPGATLSQDGRTAVLLAGAAADPNEMVRAADDLKGPLQDLSTSGVQVNPTGASLLWSDFNQANLSAMMKSEMLSWPVTLAILVLAFGALVAAGLPLLLTLAGLVASAGSLVLINHVVPVSIWAMNFAMMFALALGIDYALFIVVRFRAARMGHHENARAGDRRDHGHRRQGRPALRRHRADLALGGDAGPVPVVPVDGRRHHALGRLRPRRHPHPAAAGALQARLQDQQALPALGPHR